MEKRILKFERLKFMTCWYNKETLNAKDKQDTMPDDDCKEELNLKARALFACV